LKRIVVSLTAMGAAVAAALWLTVPAALAGTKCPASGTENFQLVTATLARAPVPVIASGVFTASGSDTISGKTDQLTFPGGGFEVLVAGTGYQDVNPKTCLITGSQHGTIKILKGTGKYSGISGNGTFQLSLLAISGRSDGKCSQGALAVAYQEIITATAKIKL
jgi:hypothetical protein